MPDLLDMAGPQGLPSFQDLMNSTQPRMMPQSPSVYAGIMYGQDAGRNDNMIAQAVQLAQLRAKIQAQQADEMSAAAPGRMDEIGLKNAQASDALADPNSVALPRATRATGVAQQGALQDKAELAGFSDYLNAYDGAKTPAQKAQLQSMMKAKGVTFKGMNPGTMSPEDFDSFMTNMRNAQVNDEKMAQFQTLWGQGGTKERIATSGNKTKLEVEQMRGQWHANVARLASSLNTTPDKVVGNILQKVTQDIPLSEPEKQVYRQYVDLKLEGALVHGAGLQPQVTMDEKGNVKLGRPDVPRGPTPDFAAPGAPKPATPTPAAAVVTPAPKVSSKAEYDAIKGGQPYFDTRDDQVYTKPLK